MGVRQIKTFAGNDPVFEKCLLPKKLEPRFKKEGILGQRDILTVF